MTVKYFIGTSGYVYPHWKESFYPPEIPQRLWLQYYADRFNTVELNSTFYRQPSEKAVTNWRDSSPENFVFAVKASRFITHIKRLKDAEDSITRMDVIAEKFENKLGPVLFQLPPNFKRDDDRLEGFLKLLSSEYDHAIEFRNDSWHDYDVYKILRRYNVGFCIFDMPELTTPITTTADFAYVRFHGKKALYGSFYSDTELSRWADDIKTLNVKRLYAYFNNDVGAYAIINASTLKKMLDVPQKSPS